MASRIFALMGAWLVLSCLLGDAYAQPPEPAPGSVSQIALPVTSAAGAEDAMCFTATASCEGVNPRERPPLLLVTRGDPLRLTALAEALASTYSVVVPDLAGLSDADAEAKVKSVAALGQEHGFLACCSGWRAVAAIVFLSDAADLGLSMLSEGGCLISPAHRVVLVAPRTALPRVRACTLHRHGPEFGPVVIGGSGECTASAAVLEDTLAAGPALSLEIADLCGADATASDTCTCATSPSPESVGRFATLLVDALNRDMSVRMERLDAARARGELVFDVRPPAVSDGPSYRLAFGVTLGGGVFVRGAAGERETLATGPAFSVRGDFALRSTPEAPLGFGLYAEAGSLGIFGARDIFAGAGAELVLSSGSGWAVIPSLGFSGGNVQDGFGLSTGVYFGRVGPQAGPAWPLGGRFDARVGFGPDRVHVFTFSLQVELDPFVLTF